MRSLIILITLALVCLINITPSNGSCDVTRNGRTSTQKEADRYCNDDGLGYKTCEDGQWKNEPCPANSKCMALGWDVLCRQMNLRPEYKTPEEIAQENQQ